MEGKPTECIQPTFHFEPHGLVDHWTLRPSYLCANEAVDQESGASLKEYSEYDTLHYFQDLFNGVIFRHKNFVVNSYGPLLSTPGPEKYCDTIVRFTNENHVRHTTCFAECRGRDDLTPPTLIDIEEHTRIYCTDYLTANPEVSHIHACTMVGVKIRIWVMSRDDRILMPLWGTPERGDISSYKDTGLDENIVLLTQSFRQMTNGEFIPSSWDLF